MTSTTPLHLLLVDDDEATRLTLSALLEDEGFTVETASSILEASARIDGGPSCSVVVLDAHLPDGLGAVLVPRIRDRWPSAKIVSSSGDDVPVVAGSPFDGVVSKAAGFAVLLGTVRTLLESA